MNDMLVDRHQSAVSWPSVIAGSVIAAAISIALLILGSGLGWATLSPFSGFNYEATKFTIGAAIWLIIMQWISSGFGGYFAGRLRMKWGQAPADEVLFRDTAHGFLAWALATILVAAVLASTMATIVKTGGAIVAAEQVNEESSVSGFSLTYPVDEMFRTSSKVRVSQDVRGEAAQIVIRGIADDTFSDDDKAYLRDLVVVNTGLSAEAATQRVEGLMFEVDAMKLSAEKAQKAGAMFALVTFLSMLIGAFIASVTAICGGRHRDLY